LNDDRGTGPVQERHPAAGLRHVARTVLKSTPRASSRPALDIGPVAHVIGWFTAVLGVLMLAPAIVDYVAGNPDWQVFAVSAAATVFAGTALVLSTQRARFHLTLQQGFMLTTGVWISSALAGALPFLFSQLDMNLADAFFEAMSGITTTGSTVIAGLDKAPPGILLWRGILQAFGGIGFIAVGLAMLPFLKVGGMQLFRLESSERSDKAVPQAKRFATLLVLVYLAAILACALALNLAGMTPFEAIVHAMTTLSTGGFSTSDASVGHFASPLIDGIITVFMIVGCLPFILYIRLVQGRPEYLWRDAQVRSFLRFVFWVILGLSFWLWLVRDFPLAHALRLSAFNVTSVVSTTGFVTDDYSLWGEFAVIVFFLLTFVGGCTGSTAGGLKAFRFDLLGLALRVYTRRLIFPHGTFVATYNGRTVTDDVFAGVLMFMGVYFITVAVTSVFLALTGLDALTCLSGAATAVGNVGPGLGPIIGPAGNFTPLPDFAKWVLSIAMLLGRLELFTVLALFSRRFWRT
jgi:trk system potassium uptake protein TrkH